MATFVFAKGDPNKVKAAAKARGYNPPGARTRNEPERVVWREETPVVYEHPKAQADTPALRKRVALAALHIDATRNAYLKALTQFQWVGPLPNSIVNDLPLRIRRQVHLPKINNGRGA
jgi:hypothetical protein